MFFQKELHCLPKPSVWCFTRRCVRCLNERRGRSRGWWFLQGTACSPGPCWSLHGSRLSRALAQAGHFGGWGSACSTDSGSSTDPSLRPRKHFCMLTNLGLKSGQKKHCSVYILMGPITPQSRAETTPKKRCSCVLSLIAELICYKYNCFCITSAISEYYFSQHIRS